MVLNYSSRCSALDNEVESYKPYQLTYYITIKV